MFISVILNTEYAHISLRSTWYLKNMLHSKENGWIIITHEYLWKHFEEIQKDITPRLFKDFEMRPFTAEEVRDVEQYFIPDEIFDNFEKQYGSRTEMLYQLQHFSNDQLYVIFQDIFDSIKKKHPSEQIDGVFYSLDADITMREVCKNNNVPLIPYSFSSIKKPHGYRQTLYHTNLKTYLHTAKEAKHRYKNYLAESASLPVFSHRELIAIIGKERTLPLIPLMKAEPVYEMGLCTECFSIIPQFFVHDKTTDDDIRYECDKIYSPSQITVRNHAFQIDSMQLDRSTVHNDPAAWILSCRRLTAARSQIGLKVLLWDRTVVIKPDTLGFSFMCEKDYASTNKVNLQALNYYLFGYLIPNDLMFSDKYWKWRMTNPSESEIYHYHLDFLIDNLNLPKSIWTEQDEQKRFKSILESRGCDKELVKILLEDKHNFDIDYNTASSRIVVNGKSYWRLNKLENGVRHFHIELDESAKSVEFYPLDDVAGCAKLISVSVNGKKVDVSQFADFKYMPKVTGHYTLPLPTNGCLISVDIKWDYQSNNEFLNAHA